MDNNIPGASQNFPNSQQNSLNQGNNPANNQDSQTSNINIRDLYLGPLYQINLSAQIPPGVSNTPTQSEPYEQNLQRLQELLLALSVTQQQVNLQQLARPQQVEKEQEIATQPEHAQGDLQEVRDVNVRLVEAPPSSRINKQPLSSTNFGQIFEIAYDLIQHMNRKIKDKGMISEVDREIEKFIDYAGKNIGHKGRDHIREKMEKFITKIDNYVNMGPDALAKELFTCDILHNLYDSAEYEATFLTPVVQEALSGSKIEILVRVKSMIERAKEAIDKVQDEDIKSGLTIRLKAYEKCTQFEDFLERISESITDLVGEALNSATSSSNEPSATQGQLNESDKKDLNDDQIAGKENKLIVRMMRMLIVQFNQHLMESTWKQCRRQKNKLLVARQPN